MSFEIIGEVTDVETIAVGRAIRELARLRRRYGRGRWRKLKGVARVRLRSGRIASPSYTGTRRAASAGRKSSVSVTSIKHMRPNKKAGAKFAVCINNADYPASLELHKIYRVLPDADADGDVRVIDESGEDYLYPSEYFVPIVLPRSVEESLLRAA